MNDGIISIILFFIFMFLLIGGWINQELKETGWGASTIVLTLLFLLIAPTASFSLFDLNFGVLFVLLPLIIIGTMLKMSYKERVYVFLGGILIAFLYNLFVELLTMDPILIIFDERLLIGLSLGLIIGMFNLTIKMKLALPSIGIWLGMLYFVFKHYHKLGDVPLFSYYELDLLFTLYFSIALMHLLFISISRWIVKKVHQPQGSK